LLLAAPLVLLYFLDRIRRDRRYARGFNERLGYLPFSPEVTAAAPVWLHAVSVGEVLSAVELGRRIRAEYPAAPVYVSVTTVAGRALANEKLKDIAAGAFYAPLDYRWCLRRVLRLLRPALVVILETEIWPNLYREVKRTNAALLVVNGRISDRALPRYRRFRWFFQAALACPDRILAQTTRDRGRFIEAGAPPNRTLVGGNIKYDFRPPPGEIPGIADFVRRTGPGEIWIAASTMPPADNSDVDEDDAVIDAFQQLRGRHGALLLIHVPRKPERFDVVAAKLSAAGIPFVRRSRLDGESRGSLPGVLLLDTIGELSKVFAMAGVVFMGGSLARRGGHNILEPAFFGKAVIVGPHMENFAEIAEEFRSCEAMAEIASPEDLAPAIHALLTNESERDLLGARARSVAENKRGAANEIVARLLEHYFRSVPCRPGSFLLAPLASIWRLGVEWDRARKLAVQSRLASRVISIGNVTLGGVGKTPVVEWLAGELKNRGLRPAILTRGYRRRSPELSIVIPAGSPAPAEVTGDEAQIYVRGGVADVGIGSDRGSTGRLLEQRLSPDIFILDDGFQHWRLYRDVDIVLIDALDPFGGCRLFPGGRLREPLAALARADAFVITRAEPEIRTDGIERVLRDYNVRAPVFRSRVVPRGWVNAATGEAFGLAQIGFSSAAAFCGLGNPLTFWATLRALPVDITLRWTFGDHHFYRGSDLRFLAGQAAATPAEALVTTQKDAMNLPENFQDLVKGFPVYYLRIGIELEQPERFLDLCLGR
jgi:3-deoxy-D-manno-octulosonic-acid transferase